jgi:hypothetical protein
MFSERGQRIPGWAPVKQWTEGPTALRRRLGHSHHALPGCRSRTQLPAVGPAIPKAPARTPAATRLPRDRRHRTPSAPRPAVSGRYAAPVLPSSHASPSRVREGPRTITENGQPYSMTWSATASSLSGTLRPSDFAVLRLMTSSYLIGCWIGRSVSLAPLRMRSMYPAAWRSSSEKSAL